MRRPVLLRPKQMADVLGELLLQSLRLGDVIGKLLAHAIDGIFKLSPPPPLLLLLLLRSQRGSRLLLGVVPPDVIPKLTGTCPRPPLPPGFLVRDACQQSAAGPSTRLAQPRSKGSVANAPLTVEVFEAVALASASAQTVVLSDGSHPPISYSTEPARA